MRIISTKILPEIHQQRLIKYGIDLVEYNAILIENIRFESPEVIDNAIFTSKNAIKAVLEQGVQVKNAFVVGDRSATILEDFNIKITCKKDYATDLANEIIANHATKSFHFFCGNLHRNELPDSLSANHITYQKIEVYNTTLNPQKFTENFDACIFLSPSAIKSHTQHHQIEKQQLFCIGNTTAHTAQQFSSFIHIAKKPTITAVVDMVIQYKENYD